MYKIIMNNYKYYSSYRHIMIFDIKIIILENMLFHEFIRTMADFFIHLETKDETIGIG